MSTPAADFLAPPHQALRNQSIEFTVAAAKELLRTKLAPWVQQLDLAVEQCSPVGASLRLPYSSRLLRPGNTICGQALMACADTAMALAIFAALGEFRNITTVGQTISFMRPIADADALIHATVQKLGKSLIFGEVLITACGSDVIAAQATSTWALVP